MIFNFVDFILQLNNPLINIVPSLCSQKEKKEKSEKGADTLVSLETGGGVVGAGADSKISPLAGPALTSAIVEAVQQANNYKLLRKGANECAKTLNKGTSDLIILAADADPLAILLHLPVLCEDKNVPYVFVESRAVLGRACGVTRPVIACSILSSGDGPLESLVLSIRQKVDDLLI